MNTSKILLTIIIATTTIMIINYLINGNNFDTKYFLTTTITIIITYTIIKYVEIKDNQSNNIIGN